MRPTLFISGGHMTPAVAVIDEIRERKLPWDIVFIGRKNSLEGTRIESVEYQEMKRRGIPFEPLVTGRISRVLTPWAVWSVLKIPIGLIQAMYYVVRHRPVLVLSFGGYIGAPVVVAARLFNIPIVVHEQTRVMGLSNRLIAKLARVVLLSYSSNHGDGRKVYYTGLPIRKELFHPPKHPSFQIGSEKPILYFTGGSTGAVTLNDALFPIIETLIHDWTIIHQTGAVSYAKALALKAMLPKNVKDRYIVSHYFSVSDVSWILCQATIVVGRSGANTVGELAALGIVSILIPLPWSGANEQQENAWWLQSQGAAIVVPQDRDTGKQIIAAINTLTSHRKTYQDAAQTLQQSIPKDASSSLVDKLVKIIGS